MKRVVLNYLVIVIFAVSSAFASGGNDDVYVAGFENNAQGVRVAKIWKNGVAQNLSDGTQNAVARSVYVSGNDVYVVGYEIDAQDNQVAKLWKNGVSQTLPDGMIASSVFVSGQNVYAVGFSCGDENCISFFWKNGIIQRLNTEMGYGYLNSVYVSGNDVYIAGYASVIKNGVTQFLDGVEVANSVFVSGNDVFIAGNGNGAVLWKNGVVQNLTNSGRDSYASSVYVSGNDVYVAGYEQNEQGNQVATLWKNGVAQNLTDGSRNGNASSVYGSGGDVYVAGNDGNVATLWKNGVAQNLTDVTNRAIANSVFVVAANNAKMSEADLPDILTSDENNPTTQTNDETTNIVTEQKLTKQGEISFSFAGYNDLTKEEHGEIQINVILRKTTVVQKTNRSGRSYDSNEYEDTTIGSGSLKKGFIINIQDPKSDQYSVMIKAKDDRALGTIASMVTGGTKVGDAFVKGLTIKLQNTMQTTDFEITVNKSVNNKGVATYDFIFK